MLTQSGTWNIINSTRYNTNDIVAVFDRYEEALDAGGQDVRPDRARDEGQVMIGDYSPTSMTYTRRVWMGPINGGSYSEQTVRVYVRGSGLTTRHLRDVGLIKPSKLYDNPVEALSAPRVDGHEVVPEGFLRAFVEHIVVPCYGGRLTHDQLESLFPFGTTHIRIMRNRADKVPEGKGRPAKLNTLKNLVDPLSWASRSMLHRFREFETENDAIGDRFEKLGLERSLTPEILEECKAALNKVREACTADSNLLRKETE
jgi:hypothetical protein